MRATGSGVAANGDLLSGSVRRGFLEKMMRFFVEDTKNICENFLYSCNAIHAAGISFQNALLVSRYTKPARLILPIVRNGGPQFALQQNPIRAGGRVDAFNDCIPFVRAVENMAEIFFQDGGRGRGDFQNVKSSGLESEHDLTSLSGCCLARMIQPSEFHDAESKPKSIS
jgi:hypothetical protein